MLLGMDINQHKGMEVFDARGSVIECRCGHRSEPKAQLSAAWDSHRRHYDAMTWMPIA